MSLEMAAAAQPLGENPIAPAPFYISLSSDLSTFDRQPIAQAGDIFDQGLIDRVVSARRPGDTVPVPLSRTGILEDLKGFLSRPTYSHLFGRVRRQFELFSLVREASLPQLLAGELAYLRRIVPWAYEQALVSASVTALLLRHQTAEAPFLREAWTACIVRDVGLSRVRPAILHYERALTAPLVGDYLQHQIISALLCARALGPGLTAHLAARHHLGFNAREHWVPPAGERDSKLIKALHGALGVADAFIGMLSPRSFRSATFSTRGAVDTLVTYAGEGRCDESTVRLLVAYCRREFCLEGLKISKRRDGFIPKTNYYGVSI